MSSYSGATTAKDQEMKRRAQKQKQQLGSKKGFRKESPEKETVRLPRVATVVFAGSTKAAIEHRIAEKPELPITTQFFKRLLKSGIEFEVTDESFGTMHGQVFKVDEKGIHTPLYLHTLRVWIGMGHGIEIKVLRGNGRVVID